MKYAVVSVAIVASVSFVIFAGCRDSGRVTADSVAPDVDPTPAVASNSTGVTPNDEVFDGHVIKKTDAEWKAQLTNAEYQVLRNAATDVAFQSP